MGKKMINVGCGNVFHPDWVNIDIVSRFPEVIEHDLTKGLPFADESVDVCYSSHVLEHLRKNEADFFISECKRALKAGGVLRLTVPDLEVICRNYLKYLDELVSGNSDHEFRYDYTILEMYDQLIRERPGGELGALWSSGMVQDLDFVRSRGGSEALDAIESGKGLNNAKDIANAKRVSSTVKVMRLMKKLRLKAAEFSIRLIMGKGALKSFKQGMFRNSGEIHRVMYDRYSLVRFLKMHGFSETKLVQAHQSRIVSFDMYQLDTVGEAPRKPDSIYIEAIRGN